MSDLQYAARQLLHNPGFALVSLMTLALGIGASTAIFSAVNPILFKPLPYPNAGRLMLIQEMKNSGSPRHVSFATFHGLAEGSHSFDVMAMMKLWQRTMVGVGLAITTIVGLVVGLMPALQAPHSDPHGALQQRSRTNAGGYELTRRVLVISEIAFALVLLVGAGLLLRSLERLFAINRASIANIC